MHPAENLKYTHHRCSHNHNEAGLTWSSHHPVILPTQLYKCYCILYPAAMGSGCLDRTSCLPFSRSHTGCLDEGSCNGSITCSHGYCHLSCCLIRNLYFRTAPAGKYITFARYGSQCDTLTHVRHALIAQDMIVPVNLRIGCVINHGKICININLSGRHGKCATITYTIVIGALEGPPVIAPPAGKSVAGPGNSPQLYLRSAGISWAFFAENISALISAGNIKGISSSRS